MKSGDRVRVVKLPCPTARNQWGTQIDLFPLLNQKGTITDVWTDYWKYSIEFENWDAQVVRLHTGICIPEDCLELIS